MFPLLPLGSHLPWLLLSSETKAHSCPLLTLPLRFSAASEHQTSLPLPLMRARSCALFSAPRGCHLLCSQRIRYRGCYCCLPCSEVIFLNLFWLFTSHVLTSFACSGLFLLLNGSWCFTWRRALFFFFLWIMQSVQDTICLWETPELMWPDNRKVWFFMPSSQKFANMKATLWLELVQPSLWGKKSISWFIQKTLIYVLSK